MKDKNFNESMYQEIVTFFENEDHLVAFLKININFASFKETGAKILSTMEKDRVIEVLECKVAPMSKDEIEIIFSTDDLYDVFQILLAGASTCHHLLNFYPYLLSTRYVTSEDLSFMVNNCNRAFLPLAMFRELSFEAKDSLIKNGEIKIPSAIHFKVPINYEDVALESFYQSLYLHHLRDLFGDHDDIINFPQRRYLLHLFNDQQIQAICERSNDPIDRDFILYNLENLYNRFPIFVNYFKDENKLNYLLQDCNDEIVTKFMKELQGYEWIDEILGNLNRDSQPSSFDTI